MMRMITKMSQEFLNFLMFAAVWVPVGWLGMMTIGFYRWYYMYKPIELNEILGWGLIVGALSGPCVFIFMIISVLMIINWDMTIIPSRNKQKQYEQDRARY